MKRLICLLLALMMALSILPFSALAEGEEVQEEVCECEEHEHNHEEEKPAPKKEKKEEPEPVKEEKAEEPAKEEKQEKEQPAVEEKQAEQPAEPEPAVEEKQAEQPAEPEPAEKEKQEEQQEQPAEPEQQEEQPAQTEPEQQEEQPEEPEEPAGQEPAAAEQAEPVLVTFVCDALSLEQLEALEVKDAEKNVMEPFTEEIDRELIVHYGTYYLLPGTYTYSLRGVAGYEDIVKEKLVVKGDEPIEIELKLTASAEKPATEETEQPVVEQEEQPEEQPVEEEGKETQPETEEPAEAEETAEANTPGEQTENEQSAEGELSTELSEETEPTEEEIIVDPFAEEELPATQGTSDSGDWKKWQQGDSRWGSLYLGGSASGGTCAYYGCLAVSVTKLIIQSGCEEPSNFTPYTFITKMNSVGGFDSDGLMDYAKPANVTSGFSYIKEDLTSGSLSSTTIQSTILNYVRDGYQVVVFVDGHHYVPVDNEVSLANNTVYIMDPSYPSDCLTTITSHYSSCGSLIIYKGKQSTIEPSYLSKCQNYSCAGTIKPKQQTSIYSLPCNSSTCADSEVVGTAKTSDSFEVVRLWKNTYSDPRYWYEIKYNNKQAFIFSNHVDFTENWGSVSTSNVQCPTTHTGGVYLLEGTTVTSTKLALKQVYLKVYKSGSSTNQFPNSIIYPNSTKYVCARNDSLDSNATFNTLSAGTYTFELYAVREMNKPSTTHTPMGSEKSVKVYSKQFTVTDGSGSGSGSGGGTTTLSVTGTTEHKYKVSIPANYVLHNYTSPTATSYVVSDQVNAQANAYTITCTAKYTLSDGSVRYRWTTGNTPPKTLYFTYDSSKMSVTEVHTYVDGVCSCGAKDPNYKAHGEIRCAINSLELGLFDGCNTETLRFYYEGNFPNGITLTYEKVGNNSDNISVIWEQWGSDSAGYYKDITFKANGPFSGTVRINMLDTSTREELDWEDIDIEAYWPYLTSQNGDSFRISDGGKELNLRFNFHGIAPLNLWIDYDSDELGDAYIVDDCTWEDGNIIYFHILTLDTTTMSGPFTVALYGCDEGESYKDRVLLCSYTVDIEVYHDCSETGHSFYPECYEIDATTFTTYYVCEACGATKTESEPVSRTGTCGKNVIWSYADGVITISGTGPMDEYDYGEQPYWSYFFVTKTVKINSGVTGIGDYCFIDFCNLTSVTIPGSVTRIGNRAFEGCEQLASVTIPAGVTTIGDDAFRYCESLTSINLPASVTSIGENAFGQNGNLKRINVDSNNAYYCSLNGVLYSKDKKMLFCCPGGIKSYTIPSSCTTIAAKAFFDSGLTSVTIPSGVQSIEWAAFCFCTELSSVTIPSGVDYIDEETFAYCYNLTSVTIPKSVLEIGDCAFYECYNITDVYYSGTKAQWYSMEIGEENDWLTDANIHCSNGTIGHDCDSQGHWYVEDGVTKQATCTTTGVIRYKCKYCSETFTNTLEKLPHELVHHAAVAATCGVAGNEAYDTCKNCSYTTFKSIPALKHDYRLSSQKAATCTEDGYKKYTCANCGDVKAETLTKLGHNTVHHAAVAAGCYNFGNDAYDTCTRCDYTTYVAIPAGHRYVKGVCSVCGTIDAEYSGTVSLKMGQNYLVLEPGQSVTLTTETEPAFLSKYILWQTEGSAISFDNGKVTATDYGTSTVTAYAEFNGNIYSDSCRIDVVNDKEELTEQVCGAQLLTNAATVEIYRTKDYATVSIMPILEQNLKTLQALGGTEQANRGVIVSSARFVNGEAEGYFKLRVKDDRTLEIIPTERAVSAAKSGSKDLKSSYSSYIELTLCGEKYVVGPVKLTVKKSTPAMQAVKVTLNSYPNALGARTEIEVNGATVTKLSLKSAKPAWLQVDEENRTVALSKTNIPAKYTSGKLSFSCVVDGWAVPATLDVSYSVKSTAPALKFGGKSATLMPGTTQSVEIPVTVSGEPFTDGISFPVVVTKIEQQVGKEYVQINNNTLLSAVYKDGKLLLSAPKKPQDLLAHTYRVTLSVAGKAFTYTVKTGAPGSVALTAKGTGDINTMVTGSPYTVTLTPKNFAAGSGERYGLVRIEQYTGSTLVNSGAKSAFTVTQNGNVFNISEKSAGRLVSGSKYQALFGIDTDSDGAWDGYVTVPLKVTFAKTAPAIKVAMKATGSIDPLRPDTAITLVPTISNWYGAKNEKLVFTMKSGTSTVELGEYIPLPFDVTNNADGSYTLKANSSLVTGASYSVKLVCTIGGSVYASSEVKLAVKKGTAKVTSSVSSAVLYKNDRFSRVNFSLSIPDKTVAPISRVELDAASAETMQIVVVESGIYALEYKDNLLPASFKNGTAKLSVFVEGCETSVAAVSIKVSYK